MQLVKLHRPINWIRNKDNIDIDIDPNDPLPANGTIVISTEGGTDLDMNEFPPVGVTVVTTNDTITVSNQTVTIGEGGGDEGEEE
jgi:hypothetical protein